MPMQSLLGGNHRQPLLHMAKSLIWVEEIKQRIHEFSIGYMINPTLNINKAFKEQVTKFIKTTFGAITQPYIRNVLSKNNTILLSLLMFYETRNNPKKVFKVLIFSLIQ